MSSQLLVVTKTMIDDLRSYHNHCVDEKPNEEVAKLLLSNETENNYFYVSKFLPHNLIQNDTRLYLTHILNIDKEVVARIFGKFYSCYLEHMKYVESMERFTFDVIKHLNRKSLVVVEDNEYFLALDYYDKCYIQNQYYYSYANMFEQKINNSKYFLNSYDNLVPQVTSFKKCTSDKCSSGSYSGSDSAYESRFESSTSDSATNDNMSDYDGSNDVFRNDEDDVSSDEDDGIIVTIDQSKCTFKAGPVITEKSDVSDVIPTENETDVEPVVGDVEPVVENVEPVVENVVCAESENNTDDPVEHEVKVDDKVDPDNVDVDIGLNDAKNLDVDDVENVEHFENVENVENVENDVTKIDDEGNVENESDINLMENKPDVDDKIDLRSEINAQNVHVSKVCVKNKYHETNVSTTNFHVSKVCVDSEVCVGEIHSKVHVENNVHINSAIPSENKIVVQQNCTKKSKKKFRYTPIKLVSGSSSFKERLMKLKNERSPLTNDIAQPVGNFWNETSFEERSMEEDVILDSFYYDNYTSQFPEFKN